MLSVLIPCYNYYVLPLVVEIQKQADELGMDYEILVQDDWSHLFTIENARINSIPHCVFSTNNNNLGRGKNINLLCSKSKHEYILILEADAFPENKFYLKNFLDSLTKATTVIFGGVKYPKDKPPKEKKLRWQYGNSRETKSLRHRYQNEYDFVFTWNLLLKKEILIKYPFPEEVHNYGYEDLIFIKKLQFHAIPITHIENPLIHFNNELSVDFIKKTEIAVDTLYHLIRLQKINYEDTRLSALYQKLNKLHLVKPFSKVFSLTKKHVLIHLTSNNPQLYVLDFYKLGYFCSLSASKNV